MDYNKQTFDHVIRQSIKKFMTGDLPEETLKMLSEEGKEVKYTPEFFDELEKELLSDKEKEDKKKTKKTKKSKKKKKEDLEMSDGGYTVRDMGGDMMGGIAGIGDGYAKAYKDAAANTDKSKFVTPELPRRR